MNDALTRREVLTTMLAAGAAMAMPKAALGQVASAWTAPQSHLDRWDLSNPEQPLMAVQNALSSYTYIWSVGNRGTDFVVDLDLLQMQDTGSHYGLLLGVSGGGTVEVYLTPDARNTQGAVIRAKLVVRRMPGYVVLGNVDLNYSVGLTYHMRVVATDDRLQISVTGPSGVNAFTDIRGAAAWSGDVGLLSYNVIALLGPMSISEPTSIADCLDLRPDGNAPWWFAGQSNVQVPIRIRDARAPSAPARASGVQASVRFDTQQTSSASQSYSIPARAWSPQTLSIDLGNEALYWVELRDLYDASVLYGEWPVARHPVTAPNLFPASTFALGAYNKPPPLIDLVARKTYWHALCHALLRDSFNALFGVHVRAAEELDIFQQHGISVVLLPPGSGAIASFDPAIMHHPAVLAHQIGDEPGASDSSSLKAKYDAYKTHWSSRPALTTMVAESAAAEAASVDFHKLWRDIGAESRAIRFYPFRKSAFGFHSSLNYRGFIGGPDALVWMNAGLSSPWYYVAQTFSSNSSAGAEVFWRTPTGAEAVSTLHTATMLGAQGYFCFSYQERPSEGAYNTFVKPRTLVPLSTAVLDSVRACNERMRHWPAPTRGQRSFGARAPDVPYEIYTRMLMDGTIALVNLDPTIAITYASTDLVRASSYDDVQTASWSAGTVTIPPGGIAFGTPANSDDWQPAAGAPWRDTCQSIIDAVTPVAGPWPSALQLPAIEADYAAAEWHRQVAFGGGAELSPLSVLRLLSARQSAPWTFHSAHRTSVTGWRMAQVGYAFGARAAIDVDDDEIIGFGPYTPDNNPPTFADGASLIATGTFCADQDFRSSNRHVLVVPRYLGTRIFLIVISLTGTETLEIASSTKAGTSLRDAYSGTLQTIARSAGLYRVSVNLTSPGTLLRVYEWQA